MTRKSKERTAKEVLAHREAMRKLPPPGFPTEAMSDKLYRKLAASIHHGFGEEREENRRCPRERQAAASGAEEEGGRMNSLRFFINRGTWGDVRVDFLSRETNGKRMVAMPIVMSLVDAGEVAPESMMRINEADAPEALQSLMDELWRHGVRPADIGTPGHLAATTKHLEDMRTIVFANLETPKP